MVICWAEKNKKQSRKYMHKGNKAGKKVTPKQKNNS
mgnify:CR=1 FL=1